MNNHMEQAAKAAKKPPTNEASAGLSSASDIGPFQNFGVAVHNSPASDLAHDAHH